MCNSVTSLLWTSKRLYALMKRLCVHLIDISLAWQMAKGFRGRSKNCYRIAKQSVEKALQYAYRDRKQKKRDMRSLWIQRVNAGSKEHGVRCLSCLATLALIALILLIHTCLYSLSPFGLAMLA